MITGIFFFFLRPLTVSFFLCVSLSVSIVVSLSNLLRHELLLPSWSSPLRLPEIFDLSVPSRKTGPRGSLLRRDGCGTEVDGEDVSLEISRLYKNRWSEHQ